MPTSSTTKDHQYVQRFWHVPAAAVLVGALALLSSFTFGPSYQAGTMLLVRVGNTTFFSNTGNTIGDQSSILDSTVSKSISDTESALLGNYTVARQVVSQLHLAKPPHSSLLGHVKNAVTDLYEFVVHGGIKHLTPYNQAVQNVQNGLAANQLNDSFLIALTATGSSQAQATAIANTASNDLVTLIEAQSQSAAVKNRQYLSAQLSQADQAEQQAAQALGNFAGQNHIDPATLSALFDSTTATDLRQQLAQTQANLQGAQAQLSSDQEALAATSPTNASTQQVQTGRSSTQITQTQQSPVYQQLEQAVTADKAQIASLQATSTELSTELTPSTSAAQLTPSQQSQLAQLEQSYTTTSGAYQSVQTEYEQAATNVSSDPIQISRVDRAVAGAYPVAPKRYLFLGIGILLGLVAGFLLSAMAARRRGETLFVSEWEDAPEQAEPTATNWNGNGHASVADLIPVMPGGLPERTIVGGFELFTARRRAGDGPGSGSGNRNGA